jgi:hypothetical protein
MPNDKRGWIRLVKWKGLRKTRIWHIHRTGAAENHEAFNEDIWCPAHVTNTSQKRSHLEQLRVCTFTACGYGFLDMGSWRLFPSTLTGGKWRYDVESVKGSSISARDEGPWENLLLGNFSSSFLLHKAQNYPYACVSTACKIVQLRKRYQIM